MNGTCRWFAGVVVLLVASQALAQTVYTWRDENGVVHFSDENPEGVKGVETLTLEQPAPLVSETGEGGEPQMMVTPAPARPEGEGGAQGEGPPPADAITGAAEVLFQGAELSPIGDTRRRVRGKLRNAGGDTARMISVRVVIADGDTGNLCITTEIFANPRDLGPGESGGFEGELDTPCFYGNPKIAYYPEWD